MNIEIVCKCGEKIRIEDYSEVNDGKLRLDNWLLEHASHRLCRPPEHLLVPKEKLPCEGCKYFLKYCSKLDCDCSVACCYAEKT